MKTKIKKLTRIDSMQSQSLNENFDFSNTIRYAATVH